MTRLRPVAPVGTPHRATALPTHHSARSRSSPGAKRKLRGTVGLCGSGPRLGTQGGLRFLGFARNARFAERVLRGKAARDAQIGVGQGRALVRRDADWLVVTGCPGDEGAGAGAHRLVARNHVPTLVERLVLGDTEVGLFSVVVRDRARRDVVVGREEKALFDDDVRRGRPDRLTDLLAVGAEDVGPFGDLPLPPGRVHAGPFLARTPGRLPRRSSIAPRTPRVMPGA